MRRIILLLTLGVVVVPALASAGEVFVRSLRPGDVGADVLALQKLLNEDPATRIAEVGSGSPGQESTYFGAKTKQAIVRFQELYAGEILAPSGLVSGTGFVGEKTRQKLNALLAGGGRGAAEKLTISSFSTTVAYPGESITVYGYELGRSLKAVVFDTKTIPVFAHPNNLHAAVFTVPSEVTSGVHQVQVIAGDGRGSNKLKLRVVGSGAASTDSLTGPNISQLSPSRGGYGATITIIGSGFSQLPVNKILVGAQLFSNVASPDGRTLSIVLPPLMEGLAFAPETLTGVDVEFPLGVVVSNPLGESSVAVLNFTFYK